MNENTTDTNEIDYSDSQPVKKEVCCKCGKSLSKDEMKYYGNTCNQCEGDFSEAMDNERNNTRPTQTEEGVKPVKRTMKIPSGTDSIIEIEFSYCGNCDACIDDQEPIVDNYCYNCGKKVDRNEVK